MKKFVSICTLLVISIFFLHAQKPVTTVKKKPVSAVTKVQPPQIILKTLEDSANYAIGTSVGNFYRSQGIKKINSALCRRGINDVMENKSLLMDDVQANNAITNCINQAKNPKTKPVVKTPPKITNPSLPLKTLQDSADYAMGLSVANFYKIQGVSKINASLIVETVSAILAGKKSLLTDEQCATVINLYLTELQVWKSKPAIIAGEQFLAENKKRQGVTTTASGLQYEVIKEGTGPRPTLTDTVVCHYKGMFMNGTVFDESYTRNQPAEFAVTGVIKGWTEALQLMPVGSKYKLYVPYTLGYGINDYFSIPGGSTMVFEVELLSIKGK